MQELVCGNPFLIPVDLSSGAGRWGTRSPPAAISQGSVLHGTGQHHQARSKLTQRPAFGSHRHRVSGVGAALLMALE